MSRKTRTNDQDERWHENLQVRIPPAQGRTGRSLAGATPPQASSSRFFGHGGAPGNSSGTAAAVSRAACRWFLGRARGRQLGPGEPGDHARRPVGRPRRRPGPPGSPTPLGDPVAARWLGGLPRRPARHKPQRPGLFRPEALRPGSRRRAPLPGAAGNPGSRRRRRGRRADPLLAGTFGSDPVRLVPGDPAGNRALDLRRPVRPARSVGHPRARRVVQDAAGGPVDRLRPATGPSHRPAARRSRAVCRRSRTVAAVPSGWLGDRSSDRWGTVPILETAGRSAANKLAKCPAATVAQECPTYSGRRMGILAVATLRS